MRRRRLRNQHAFPDDLRRAVPRPGGPGRDPGGDGGDGRRLDALPSSRRPPDFCELAARVACVKSLRSELADRDLTATERAALDRLAADPCDWIRNEAKGALDDLADPLPNQVAAHDGAEDFEPELRTFEARGVTVEDHARLNYIRANSTGGIRNQAGALLVKLAGVAK